VIIRINDTELAWLGYSRADIVGRKHHSDLMTRESAEYFNREAFPLFKRQGWLKNVEFRYVRKNGTTMPAALNATAVYDANGHYVMSRSTIYDIGDRKQAEAVLAGQFATLQTIMDNLPGAVSMFDRDLKMTACNDKFKTLLALPDELFSAGPPSFERLIRHNAQRGEYGPGDPAALTAQIVERTRGASAHCFERTRPDGTVLEIRGTPLANGGFVTYYADITERKQIERALRERDERFRLLVNAVKDYAIIMLDPHGYIATWNEGAERIKGYRAEDIIGQHFSRFYPPANIKSGEPAVELKTAEADGYYEDEGWRVRRDGSTFWASVVITAIRDDAGTLRGFSKVTQDLTHRKRAEEEISALNTDLQQRAALLEVANKELESFSYSVSHDLRTPLRAIDGYSQMLDEDYAATLDGEGRRLLGTIRASSQKMSALIDDLLAFSRLGRSPATTTAVDMNALVGEVIRGLEPAFPAKRPAIVIAKMPPTHCDRALIAQVWVNLLSNAVKFTRNKPDARIDVGFERQETVDQFWVKDNGAGFDMQYYNKLFGVFQRLHSEEEFPGTGVGLAIVQRIVTRHGGRVWAESKIDEGAVFYFSLPHGESDESIEPGGDTSGRRQQDGRRIDAACA
jgi:PAS domain S-box-containing protein